MGHVRKSPAAATRSGGPMNIPPIDSLPMYHSIRGKQTESHDATAIDASIRFATAIKLDHDRLRGGAWAEDFGGGRNRRRSCIDAGWPRHFGMLPHARARLIRGSQAVRLRSGSEWSPTPRRLCRARSRRLPLVRRLQHHRQPNPDHLHAHLDSTNVPLGEGLIDDGVGRRCRVQQSE